MVKKMQIDNQEEGEQEAFEENQGEKENKDEQSENSESKKNSNTLTSIPIRKRRKGRAKKSKLAKKKRENAELKVETKSFIKRERKKMFKYGKQTHADPLLQSLKMNLDDK